MPELPELRLASMFINSVAKGVLFKGSPIKSAVSKCPVVKLEPRMKQAYSISSDARGKELLLKLSAANATDKMDTADKDKDKDDSLSIVFRFGMSGRFTFTDEDAVEKHSHLQFRTADGQKVLSFVDPRRFGRWGIEGFDQVSRGPDPAYQHEAFRQHLKECLANDKIKSHFEKPICEVMLDQRYFNGVGNYLRAEILHRAEIPPFEKARVVLERVLNVKEHGETEEEQSEREEEGKDEEEQEEEEESIGLRRSVRVKRQRRAKTEEPSTPVSSSSTSSSLSSLLVSPASPSSLSSPSPSSSPSSSSSPYLAFLPPLVPPPSNNTKDLLWLCYQVCREVIELGLNVGEGGKWEKFSDWLRCYQKADYNVVDSKGRTIWYFGEAGSMAPKGAKKKAVKARKPPSKTTKRSRTKTQMREVSTSSSSVEVEEDDRGVMTRTTKVETKTNRFFAEFDNTLMQMTPVKRKLSFSPPAKVSSSSSLPTSPSSASVTHSAAMKAFQTRRQMLATVYTSTTNTTVTSSSVGVEAEVTEVE